MNAEDPRPWCLICHAWGHTKERHIPTPTTPPVDVSRG